MYSAVFEAELHGPLGLVAEDREATPGFFGRALEELVDELRAEPPVALFLRAEERQLERGIERELE